MVFCSSNTETINATNYNDLYQSGTRVSVLPNNGAGFSPSDFESHSSIISSGKLTSHVASLLSSREATGPHVDNIVSVSTTKTFSEKSNKLRDDITNEYCFYYKRYMWALTEILTKATSISSLSPAARDAYDIQKRSTEKINSLLNQLLQILQEIRKTRKDTIDTYYGVGVGVNKLNLDIDNTRTKLVTHSELLKSKSMETDVHSAMIDYTLEKNASSRNLLAVYGFMNIVAIGLLFYLYRSSKN